MGESPGPVQESDAALLVRAQAGDAAAFTTLYQRYAGRVYDYCMVRLRDHDAAEDATQTVFERVAKSLHTCRNGDAFAGWLFRIARNTVIDTARSASARPRPVDEPLDAVADPDLTPEEWALAQEERAAIQAARERCLVPRERPLFDLLLAGLNDREIAEALGRGHGAVRMAHSRLLEKLRRCFGMRRPDGNGEGSDARA